MNRREILVLREGVGRGLMVTGSSGAMDACRSLRNSRRCDLEGESDEVFLGYGEEGEEGGRENQSSYTTNFEGRLRLGDGILFLTQGGSVILACKDKRRKKTQSPSDTNRCILD